MNKTEKFFDRIASKYDIIEQNDIAYSIFIEKTATYLKTDDTILDFGCGTGLICNEIAGNAGKIHAIDISAKMIEIAKYKASERKIQNIDFERTSIFDEKFKAGSIDAIIAFNIFHLLEEPQKYFQRIHQLLKPGGFVISATPCMLEAPGLNYVLKFFSFIGLTPKLNSFTSPDLELFFTTEFFKIIETSCIKKNSPQHLLIAKG